MIDTITNHAGFLEAICADPDDDVSRLVYADWLDEHDDPDRAEFIRLQIALASSSIVAERIAREQPERLNRLALNLLHHWQEWSGPAAELVPNGARYSDHLTFRRGFIEYVRCTGDAWVRHADAILVCQPVREVTLTTWPGLMQFCLESPEGDEMRIGLPGRPFRGDVPPSTNPIPFLLRAEWPRIRFHLPESS